ncbi:MAG: hypothetical protein P4L22_04305 [Candidatus Babeliales bacterium]|nr:hypothetical protein [Candidatus Babeliales bacterium]
MKFKFILLSFVLMLPLSNFLTRKVLEVKIIKAKTSDSRFGNCLLIVYWATYLSKKYNIPFIYYEKFVESDNLKISNIKDLFQASFANVLRLKSENDIDIKSDKDICYEIDIDFLMSNENSSELLKDVDAEFKKLIEPIKDIELPVQQENIISCALHVRKGGGFDLPLLSQDGLQSKIDTSFIPIDAQVLAQEVLSRSAITRMFNKLFKIDRYIDLRWPLKFPPDRFYVDQIKYVAQLFKDKKLKIYLFTDDQNPEKIVKKYKKYLNNLNIEFVYRKENNTHDSNILYDFLTMAKCDCLIRPESTYSVMAEKIGNFKLVLYPAHAIWVSKSQLAIDEVGYK